jgi:hypothetical protein
MKRELCFRVFILIVLLNQSVQIFAQWTTPEPLSEINTQYGEGWCFLSFDGLTLYFSRGGTNTHYYNQMYQATRDISSGPFSNVTRIDSLAYSGGHVDNMWVSPDNLRIYYWRTEPGSVWRIKESTRATPSSPWGTPQNLAELNSLGQAGNPKLSADELSIVFNIFTYLGGVDRGALYTASRSNRDSVFTNIREVIELNTADVRVNYLSDDGLTLYFTRNDVGVYHIYMSTRPSINSSFGSPQLLNCWPEGYGFGCFSADGQTAYIGYNGDIYVSYAITDIYVNAAKGNNSNNGTSQANAVATIQRGIDLAPNGYKVLVYPGVYSGKIDFKGKAIILQGVADTNGVPVLENPGGTAVSFSGNEGADSVLKNFIIKNSDIGISITRGSPTIINLTLVDNNYGIIAAHGTDPDICNCIFWSNLFLDLAGCQASYSCTMDGVSSRHNIYANPLFVDPNNGDYHLLSERGRFWPEHKVWVLDKVTSPCINAGDPNAAYSAESAPNGERINMGAYGGTAYASMKEKPNPYPDVNGDGVVDASDLATLVDDWLEAAGWTQ